MTNFDILLWDVDGTLLDFAAAEEAAIRALFSEFGLGICTDEMLSRYSAINKKYWERLERGEMTKPTLGSASMASMSIAPARTSLWKSGSSCAST